MIERHGNLILLVGAVALIVGGLTSGASETKIGLCAVGAALGVLAVVLSRTEGPLKVGPGGLETQLAPLRREAIAQSEVVARSLDSHDLDLVNLAIGTRSLEGAPEAADVTEAVTSLVQTVNQLDDVASNQGAVVPAEVLLETARGLMASDDWAGAARYLDRYVEENPDNWEAQFARGVAHANSRLGQRSNLAALVAYSDAIAFQPDEADKNLVARLHTYRGAMFKRLGRLDEAEADLVLAQRLATNPYEKVDVAYNLACIYAMTNRRAAAFEVIRSLKDTAYIDAIRANRSGYFDSLANDDEFRSILDEPRALG